MLLLVMLITLCASPLVTFVRALAIDAIWGMLVESQLNIDPSVGSWFGLLLIWDVVTHGLKRNKADGEDAFKGPKKWGVIRALLLLYGRSLIAAGVAVGVAAIMCLMMGW